MTTAATPTPKRFDPATATDEEVQLFLAETQAAIDLVATLKGWTHVLDRAA
jgi:hypothetical protein